MTKGRIVSRTEYVTPTETSCVKTPTERNKETQPLTVTILKIDPKTVTGKTTRIGRHTRKSKGKTYSNPRLLLSPVMDEYVGARALVFRGRASVTGAGWNLVDQVVIIAVLSP